MRLRFILGPLLIAGAIFTIPCFAADQKTEQRLRQLEDREQIRDLLAEYIRCLDARDHATYSQLFAAGGRVDFRARPRHRTEGHS